MTPIALPQAIVRALRDPVPDAKDFTPTKFQPVSSKAWFVAHCIRFVSADFPRHQFTKRFYGQLMHCFSMIAHYAEIAITRCGGTQKLQSLGSGDTRHSFRRETRRITPYPIRRRPCTLTILWHQRQATASLPG